MSIDRFERIQVGDEAELFHTITAQDVDSFARLTGDGNPLHVDEEFASRTLFRHRVVHGMLTASFISTIIGTKLPGEGALWYEQSLSFLSPVRVGEEIRVWAKVLHKSKAQRLVELETTVFGRDGRKVVDGKGKVKIMESRKEDAAVLPVEKGAVIVSGASRGIGAEIAVALGRDGFPVAVNFRSGEKDALAVVERIVAAGGRALALQADVADRESVEIMVERTVEEFGFLAGVVNNAAPPSFLKSFEELGWSDFASHIDTQIKGSFNLTQAALPHLIAYGGSPCVVSISSIVAENVPPEKFTPYATAKAALTTFTKALAAEFGPRGLRANVVAPGMTETDFIADFPQKAKMVAKMQTPMRRLGTPGDVAGIVSLLFSDKAEFMTGQTLRVCGGSLML